MLEEIRNDITHFVENFRPDSEAVFGVIVISIGFAFWLFI